MLINASQLSNGAKPMFKSGVYPEINMTSSRNLDRSLHKFSTVKSVHVSHQGKDTEQGFSGSPKPKQVNLLSINRPKKVAYKSKLMISTPSH